MSNRIIAAPVLFGYLGLFWGGIAALFVFLTMNTPPGAPTLKWKETEVFTTTKLEVEIEADSVDPDGDVVTYLYQWTKNGEPVGDKDSRTISDKHLTAGEVWEVTVTPNDGTMGSTACMFPWRDCADLGKNAAKLTMTIADSPPRTRIRFLNADGREVTQLTAGTDVSAYLSCMDPDVEKEKARAADAGTPIPPPPPGTPDPCTYEVYWVNQDAPPAEGTPPEHTTPTLPAAASKAGETWKIYAKATADGVTGKESEAKIRLF